MSEKKSYRVGEIVKNKQGFDIIIRKYISNKKMEVEVMATGERRWCAYSAFKKGLIRADLQKYPLKVDGCLEVKQAGCLGLAVIGILAATIIAVIISIFK